MTLRDLAISYGTAGVPDVLIDLLSKQNALLEDMVWRAGNLETGDKFRIVAGLPGVSWRSIGQGVVATRSTQKIVTETCSLLEAVSELDKELVDLATNKEFFRAEESNAFLESMAIKLSTELWYGTRDADYRGIMGLAERFSNLTGPANKQIVDAGGTGADNSSIWIVVWGDHSVTGIYPKNTRAGLEQVASNGAIDLTDPDNNGTYQGYRDRFKWRVGLEVRDYREVVRICNIDVPALSGTAGADLLMLLNRATNRIHNLATGRPVIYMNRDVKEAWEMQLLKKQNMALTIDSATGKITTAYKGIPIKVDDNLLSTEERVA
jgi:hypothetical protein